MIEELIYTSSTKGLKLGSKGFCTVASTRGMAPNLASVLEGLSGYRHLFEPGNAKNPDVCSHLTTVVGGAQFSILSRVKDAGLDYSNRSNKLAHHIAIPVNERPATPTISLFSSGMFVDAWDEPARALDNRKIAEQPGLKLRKCQLWENYCGDAGWAGALVDAKQAGKVASIIYSPGMDLLGLISEALALMPLERQWDVTYSTFYTRLPPKVNCDWRFIPAGTNEASQAKRARNAVYIDATKKKPAGDSSAIHTARTGKQVANEKVSFNKGNRPGQKSHISGPKDQVLDETNLIDPPSIKKPKQKTPQRPKLPGGPEKPQPIANLPATRKSSNWIWTVAVAAAILCLPVAYFLGVNTNSGGLNADAVSLLQKEFNDNKSEMEKLADDKIDLSKKLGDKDEEIAAQKRKEGDLRLKLNSANQTIIDQEAELKQLRALKKKYQNQKEVKNEKSNKTENKSEKVTLVSNSYEIAPPSNSAKTRMEIAKFESISIKPAAVNLVVPIQERQSWIADCVEEKLAETENHLVAKYNIMEHVSLSGAPDLGKAAKVATLEIHKDGKIILSTLFDIYQNPESTLEANPCYQSVLKLVFSEDIFHFPIYPDVILEQSGTLDVGINANKKNSLITVRTNVLQTMPSKLLDITTMKDIVVDFSLENPGNEFGGLKFESATVKGKYKTNLTELVTNDVKEYLSLSLKRARKQKEFNEQQVKVDKSKGEKKNKLKRELSEIEKELNELKTQKMKMEDLQLKLMNAEVMLVARPRFDGKLPKETKVLRIENPLIVSIGTRPQLMSFWEDKSKDKYFTGSQGSNQPAKQKKAAQTKTPPM